MWKALGTVITMTLTSAFDHFKSAAPTLTNKCGVFDAHAITKQNMFTLNQRES